MTVTALSSTRSVFFSATSGRSQARVKAETAVTELAPLFFQHPIVLVVQGEEVLGAVPREAYFRYLGA